MISLNFLTPSELSSKIAQSARARRLALNLSQQGLASRSGVSLGTIKKFEHSGKISLGSLLKLALALKALDEFALLFEEKTPIYKSIDEVLEVKPVRKRGRK